MKNDAGGDNEDSNVYRFISDLRQEALFINSERDNLKSLNETIRNKTGKLLQTTWVTTKKRLLLLPQREFNANSFEGIASLGVTEFVEAKTAIGFQNAGKLGTFLQVLRTQPEQLAQWLIIAEQLNDEHALCLSVMQSIVSGLYGSFIFSEDINYMLLLLHELAKAQLCGAEKPQRILKHGTNSFSILYFMFHEVLLSAKYFLSAALEVPILRLLTIDYYVDVDPDKTVMRYQQEGNIRALFKDVDEYRNDVVQRLVELTDLFITAIQDNSLIFPKPLSWLICRIFERISDVKEANAVITELIFTQFICPAIVNPEQYGICDAQITTVSRHNLMQVGQTIQKLALIKYESPDITSLDLFSDLIKENKVTTFLEQLLSEMKPCPSPPVDNTPFVFRNAALYTEQELNFMLTFLHKVHEEIVQNEIYQKQCSSPDSIVTQLSALNISSIENSPKPTRRSNNSNRDSTLKRANIILFGSKNQETKSTGDMKAVANAVLIIYIGTDNIEPKGLMSEQQVIMRNFSNSELVYPKADAKLGAEIEKNGEMNEVKVSFPNYPDEGSIGNTSDNLEAISEGASNHSVASSLEMENEDQNDNYSDMVSANVSGRGTPNISGRDTPSSQVIENEDRALPEARPTDNIARPQPQLSRQIRSEIDDKFCKFEIKLAGPGGDETTSLISETWSTDVLASDNEAVDASDIRVERQCFSLIDQAIAETPVGNLLDLSETQSESAWSTDVMTSDTERLTEVDNDDTGSIAQSDDTNSVAPSDDTRSETDENATTPGSRRLSSSSFSFTSHIPAVNFSNLPSANYQDFRKVDIKSDQGTYTKIQARSNRKDNNANVIFKPFANREQTISTFSEQHTEKNNSNVTYSEHNTEIQTITFNSTNISNTFAPSNHQKSLFKINEIKEVPGPSGLHQRHSVEEDSTDPSLAYLKENRTKYMDGSMDILLSNCSLNSSSSGSSSNSFENKSSNHETSEKWENKQWLNSSQNSLNVTSTPSESTSEMSVLSVTNIINPLNMSKKSTSLTTRNMKPPASTGAIPKSISFDVTADKGDKYLDDDQRSKRGGFFGKLKMGFRYKRGKSVRNQEDFRLDGEEYLNSNSNMKKLLDSPEKLNNNLDLSDDILAKYRTKPFVESSPIKISNDSSKLSRIRHISESTVTSNEGGNTFKDIKSKLRKVLSSTKAQLPGFIKIRGISTKNKIETVLRLELGMARKLRKWSYMARISETIKCMNLLDDEKSNVKLVQSMKEDILQRSVYTQYLTCARRDLMLSESYLDGLSEQVLHERIQCEEYLAMIYVNDFLQNKESDIEIFCVEFKQLWVSDEKYDLLKNFCLRLYAEIKKDLIWKDVFKDKKETIKKTMERSVISKVYENALYPNGDGDRDRDRVLFEHIQKLSNIITPDHKYLMIQKLFLRECPWQPAQDALNAMSAYRTPRDKLNCVLQCAKCIMDLLSMAQASSTAADDFTPVLVFVIIKSNPSFLLSTIQFVNSFFHNEIFGEEQYYWTQFCSAVEFIKTMDYSD